MGDKEAAQIIANAAERLNLSVAELTSSMGRMYLRLDSLVSRLEILADPSQKLPEPTACQIRKSK